MPQPDAALERDHIAACRAIDELRRQMGVIFQEDGQSLAAFPVEFLDEARLSRLRAYAPLTLLLTAARAAALGMACGQAQALRIDATALSLAELQALADPLADAPPPALSPVAASDTQALLLWLAKQASLLPALVVVEGDKAALACPDGLCIETNAVRRYKATPLLEVFETAHALLPNIYQENSRIVSFRAKYSSSVHLALVMGDIAAEDAPLTRIHSSCVTGDILGSLRCDCGGQLAQALEQIGRAGSGIVVYLHQEGRGIGITNKLRAYRLQERGMDTYDANLLLGFDEDERDFSIAAAILTQLGVARIRMLTNNPHKKSALEQAGIHVTERVALITPSGRHNHAYLDAKAKKSGHLF